MTVAATAIEASEPFISAETPGFHRLWMDNPGRPENLLDMFEILMSELATVWPSLSIWTLRSSINAAPIPDKQELSEILEVIVRFCKLVGWTDMGNQAHRLLEKANGSGGDDSALRVLAEDLAIGIGEKLEALPVNIVAEQDYAIFKNAAQNLCGEPLHADLAISEEEFNLAGRALAVGLSTASVAHAMRSVEASLHVLASSLGLSFPGSIKLQDWMNLTEKITSEISALEKQPRSEAKTKRLKTLSELVLSADCFRLVWRNHVAHAREKYEEAEARKALGHVGEYLKKLSAML
jgi:hypothetical protein